ncbi:MAG: B12-binding domain-containing radical SAM protein [Cyanobacteriota bacterium]
MPEEGALRALLAFPSTYSVGITSLGFQVVWATLARRPDVDVRRLFTDQADPPHGGSRGRGPALDLFGLSLSWELDGPVLLDLLEQRRIPLWACERGEDDPIVFGGGPVLTANPEPLAPFFDVVLLGDGELLLPAFLDAIQTCRDAPRVERLRRLAQVEGVYVPALHAPRYSAAGTLLAVEPLAPDLPAPPGRPGWRGNTLSPATGITPEAAWPSIHMVEVVRSCPELCRFCLASYLTLPFRTASLDDGLIPAVETGLAVTRRLGLLGASVTQHPQFSELLTWLDHDRFSDVRLSVSSVRAATVTPQLSRILADRGSRSLTIAIERGSDRLRTLVNKKLAREEIFSAARHAKDGGLSGLKLYGMVGLPREEESDVEATADLLLALKRATPGLRLTLGVSTFVPKAHPPFQWEGLRPEAEKRLQRLARRLKPKGIELRPESHGWSVIQTLLSRGDRRLAPVLVAVRGQKDSLGGWKRAYRAVLAGEVETPPLDLPPPPPWAELVEATWSAERVLPWEHLGSGLPKATLWRHHQEALLQAPPQQPSDLRSQESAPARQQHPARHIDAAVIHRDVAGVEGDEHQGGGPPSTIEQRSIDHAPLGAAP